MRERKYKMWLTETKEWIIDFLIDSNGVDYFIIDDNNNLIPNAFKEKVEIVEYTGLKDKNGKEIYEGDIISGEEHWAWGKNWKKLVEFEDGKFYPFGTGDWEPDIDQIIIIGNKFENPELLESKI